MYVFDVYYVAENKEYSKSFLLCEDSEGFELKRTIGDILAKKHNSKVEVLSTELEEL